MIFTKNNEGIQNTKNMWLENILARESTKSMQVKRYGTTSMKLYIDLARAKSEAPINSNL